MADSSPSAPAPREPAARFFADPEQVEGGEGFSATPEKVFAGDVEYVARRAPLDPPRPLPEGDDAKIIARVRQMVEKNEHEFSAFDSVAILHVCALAVSRFVPDAAEDTQRLDWLEVERRRLDPIAQLVVKKYLDRHSHEWTNVSGSVRQEIDAARSAVPDAGAPQEDTHNG